MCNTGTPLRSSRKFSDSAYDYADTTISPTRPDRGLRETNGGSGEFYSLHGQLYRIIDMYTHIHTNKYSLDVFSHTRTRHCQVSPTTEGSFTSSTNCTRTIFRTKDNKSR